MSERNNDHSVRNSVLAGLGGSALGLYLGHKLGATSNYGELGSKQNYSVVHHFHQGDRPIEKYTKIEADVIEECGNVTFCPNNTRALCSTNGTVYCVADINSVTVCEEISTERNCVHSWVTLPCHGFNCNETTLISIPCLSILVVLTNSTTTTTGMVENANEISTIPNMGSIMMSSEEMSTITTTMDGIMTTTLASMPEEIGDNSTNQGNSNMYCVTVIAEPVRKPLIPPDLSNAEFMKYVSKHSQAKVKVDAKFDDLFGAMLNHVIP